MRRWNSKPQYVSISSFAILRSMQRIGLRRVDRSEVGTMSGTRHGEESWDEVRLSEVDQAISGMPRPCNRSGGNSTSIPPFPYPHHRHCLRAASLHSAQWQRLSTRDRIEDAARVISSSSPISECAARLRIAMDLKHDSQCEPQRLSASRRCNFWHHSDILFWQYCPDPLHDGS